MRTSYFLCAVSVGTAIGLAFSAAPANAHIPENKIKIGIIASGYDPGGQVNERSAVIAGAMAADDFETYAGPIDVELHETGPHSGGGSVLTDVAKWLDEDGVSLVIDAAGSNEDVAIARMVRAHKRIFVTAATSTDPRGVLCDAGVLKWGDDPEITARAVVHALAAKNRKAVFVLASQDELGTALSRDLAVALSQTHLKSAGASSLPIGVRDLPAEMQKVAQSGADALVLALQGPYLQAALRQAKADGLVERMTVIAPSATVHDIAAAGLQSAASVLVLSDFYWNQNSTTRAFADRFAERYDKHHPDARDAAVYAAVLSFLHAARARDSVDADTIVAELRHAPPQHTLFGAVNLLPDGAVAHAMDVFRVKWPYESHGEDDVFAPVSAIPPAGLYSGTCAATAGAE